MRDVMDQMKLHPSENLKFRLWANHLEKTITNKCTKSFFHQV
jgi:hypothetical protein